MAYQPKKPYKNKEITEHIQTIAQLDAFYHETLIHYFDRPVNIDVRKEILKPLCVGELRRLCVLAGVDPKVANKTSKEECLYKIRSYFTNQSLIERAKS